VFARRTRVTFLPRLSSSVGTHAFEAGSSVASQQTIGGTRYPVSELNRRKQDATRREPSGQACYLAQQYAMASIVDLIRPQIAFDHETIAVLSAAL
jgi:hypothetical protein